MRQDNRAFGRWQINPAYRSNNINAERRNAPLARSLVRQENERKVVEMTEAKNKKKVPPVTQPRAPDRELELKVKKHPEDKDAKADLGSDESMDASDPSSATQPGSSEPAPSSGFPD